MSSIIFYICYYLLFLIGGIISTYGILPYRMAYTAILPLFLIPKYGIQFDKTTRIYGLFAVVVAISAILNQSTFHDLLLFSRYIFIPYSMYYLVKNYVSAQNIQRIIRLCIGIAYIQLPVVLLQMFFYDQLIVKAVDYIAYEDFLFGTFYMADDPAMSFFLIGLTSFLLFEHRANYFIKRKLFASLWFTMTILISNSLMSNILILGIWVYYFITRLKIRNILYISMMAFFISAGVLSTIDFSAMLDKKFTEANTQLSLDGWSNQSTEKFLAGDYARGAAILYYINEPIKIWGDGPSKYYDPIKKEFFIGNRGQVFSFYSEIGLIGLLVSYLIFLISVKAAPAASKIMGTIMTLSVTMLSFTVSVMSDASITFLFYFFLRTNLAAESK